MDLRLSLYEWAAAHRLGPQAWQRLERLAGLRDEPAALADHLRRGMAVLAAALGGLGLVFWVAAHWEDLGRFGRFALLQMLIALLCAGAARWVKASAPLALAGFFAIGGVLAYFGQTYQTGADPWQLFALWAALALPMVLALRSDLLWVPWSVVALSAVSLWMHANAGHRWGAETNDLAVHLIGWAAALALVAMLWPPFRRWTGAREWSLRSAVTLGTVLISFSALSGLFFSHVTPHYALGLVALAALAAALCAPRSFDVFGLSAVALALNGLIVAGLGRGLLWNAHGEVVGLLLVLGLLAAALLAGTVSGILRLARTRAATEDAP